MKNKKKETLHLCFKYATNCKYCPRNRKCEEEIKHKPKMKVRVKLGGKNESKSN